MADYQLIVIGAGPGGYEAALRAAKLGKKVAVVERREAGGTCLNRGCIPTKTLLHASAIYRDAKNGAHCGIHTEDIHADMAEIFAYKRAVSQKLSAGIESLFKTAKIDLLRGTALITAPGAVRVTDAEGGANAMIEDAQMLRLLVSHQRAVDQFFIGHCASSSKSIFAPQLGQYL